MAKTVLTSDAVVVDIKEQVPIIPRIKPMKSSGNFSLLMKSLLLRIFSSLCNDNHDIFICSYSTRKVAICGIDSKQFEKAAGYTQTNKGISM